MEVIFYESGFIQIRVKKYADDWYSWSQFDGQEWGWGTLEETLESANETLLDFASKPFSVAENQIEAAKARSGRSNAFFGLKNVFYVGKNDSRADLRPHRMSIDD